MTVLMLLSATDFTTQWMVRGGQRQAADCGWNLQTIEYKPQEGGGVRLIRARVGTTMRGWLRSQE